MTETTLLVDVFKALAHESRLKILGLLAEQEYSVADLARLLDLRDPTVSHHLSKLHELELVTMRQEGTTHYYRLNNETLERLRKDFLSPASVASYAAATENNDADSRVLRAFVDGERLKDIPASFKKRVVVLRWLAEKFEMGREYEEKEVNAIIKQHHPDASTLRREFIMNKFMSRDHGVYWRVPVEETEAHLQTLMQGSRAED
jgi:DNA-binding transcriptional ArsR family regulator